MLSSVMNGIIFGSLQNRLRALQRTSCEVERCVKIEARRIEYLDNLGDSISILPRRGLVSFFYPTVK
jgi:uncharacterized protein YeeX (DUF496 family)